MLSVWLLATVTPALVYQKRLAGHRAEFRSLLHQKQSTKLILSQSTFEQSKIEADEISYNGTRYDLLQVQTAGDSVILTCVADGTETDLACKFHSSGTLPSKDKAQTAWFWKTDLAVNSQTFSMQCIFGSDCRPAPLLVSLSEAPSIPGNPPPEFCFHS